MTVVPLPPAASGAAPLLPSTPGTAPLGPATAGSIPDVPLGVAGRVFAPDAPASDGDIFAGALAGALDAATGTLARADAAERAFAAHRGGLQEMVLERARADVMLSLASSAASRAAQALSTILGMQV